VDSTSRWWNPDLIGGFLFSLVDSRSHRWIPVLIGGFQLSLVDSCSRWWIPVLVGGILFSLVDSCSHWWIPTGAGGAAAIGIKEASRVLSLSSDIQFVLKHLPWILELDPENGFDVLTSANRSLDGEQMFPR
jgi:hypothetical protein